MLKPKLLRELLQKGATCWFDLGENIQIKINGGRDVHISVVVKQDTVVSDY